jgi:probable HAF family extracellular repeat protein
VIIQSSHLTLILLLSPCFVKAQYTVTPIANGPEWNNSQATAINAFGDVAGVGANTSGNNNAFLYKNGITTNLGTLGGTGGGDTFVWGMNDLDDVVGMSPAVNGGNSHAFLYTNGKMTDLGALSSGFSSAWGVNNSRRVVGQAPNPPNGTMAFYRDDNSAFLQTLGNFSGGQADEAFGVNDSGWIVGSATGFGSNNWTHAYIWTNGTFLDLGQIIGSSYSEAMAINNRGDVIGFYEDTNYDDNGFYYSAGKLQFLGVGRPNSINNIGQIVGESAGIQFLYDPVQGMRNINTLLVTNSGWIVLDVTAINDAGQIAGVGETNYPTGPPRAILLTPPSNLLQPTVVSNQFQFTLQSVVARTNQVQVSSDLQTWLPLTDIVAQVPLTNIVSGTISNASQFFRVVGQ